MIFAKFANGLAPMEANAEVFAAALQNAGRHYPVSNTEDSPPANIVGGFSMGGLISRYALTAMEHRGQDHRAAAYLSLDAPHNGSRTSVSNQWFAQFFKNSVPFMQSLVGLLDSPANQQFLPLWLNEGKVFESELRKRFFRFLARLGNHPRRVVNFAISSGSGKGSAELVDDAMLKWSGHPAANAVLNPLPADSAAIEIASGYSLIPGNPPSSLDFSDGIPWEQVPGSYATYLQTLAWAIGILQFGQVRVWQNTACVVPTTSALAFDDKIDPREPIPDPPSSATWFDDYTWSEEDRQHIEITKAVRDWIVERVDSLP